MDRSPFATRTPTKETFGRTCTLSAQEFIRRFMQHVLPKGFVKVRYYGFFSPGKRRLLPKLRRLLGVSNMAKLSHEHIVPMLLQGARLNHLELRCPVCGQVMQWVETLKPNGRHPP